MPTFRTLPHHLPELSDDIAPPSALDGGPHADEADYAEEYAEALLCDAMDAERAGAAQEPDPDAARLIAEYAAQQRERAANEDHHAPTDGELAASDDFHAVCDSFTAGFLDWLSAQVEQPEHFTIACAEVAA